MVFVTIELYRHMYEKLQHIGHTLDLKIDIIKHGYNKHHIEKVFCISGVRCKGTIFNEEKRDVKNCSLE